MKFKLNPFIELPYSLPAYQLKSDGTRKAVRYIIRPDETYNTDDYIDLTPNIVEMVKDRITFVPYSQSTIDELKQMGSEYSLEGCKSCGGKITQIKVKVFEVIE